MTGCSEDLDIKEIKLTRQEKSELKEYLYETLKFLATERPEFYPRKKDSFER